MLVLHDSRCLGHEVPTGFPEKPERLREILRGLEADSRFELETADVVRRETALAAIEAVHDPAYVERLQRAVERGDGLVDTADNPISRGSFEAALAAVGCGLAGLARVEGKGAPVFAAVRPPGHHAERDHAMGFCFFNTAAVVAQAALAGARRVAIVDVDVHHGNGTQHLFERRADVFYASVHQFPFYPGTGAADERGIGEGVGCTLNVPLPAGCGDAEWLAALDGAVVPALDAFAPELLVLSAGFDAWKGDPLGGMRVSAAGFGAMGERLLGFAAERCGGRALVLLEGGYDVPALPGLVTAFLTGSRATAERDL